MVEKFSSSQSNFLQAEGFNETQLAPLPLILCQLIKEITRRKEEKKNIILNIICCIFGIARSIFQNNVLDGFHYDLQESVEVQKSYLDYFCSQIHHDHERSFFGAREIEDNPLALNVVRYSF